MVLISTTTTTFSSLIPTWRGVYGQFGLDPQIGSCSILLDDNPTYNFGFSIAKEKNNQTFNTSSADEHFNELKFRRKHPVLGARAKKSFEDMFNDSIHQKGPSDTQSTLPTSLAVSKSQPNVNSSFRKTSTLSLGRSTLFESQPPDINLRVPTDTDRSFKSRRSRSSKRSPLNENENKRRRLISGKNASPRRSRSKSVNKKASGSNRSTSHRSQYSATSMPRSTSHRHCSVNSRRSGSSKRVSRRLISESPNPPRPSSKSLNKEASGSNRSTSLRSQYSATSMPRSTSHRHRSVNTRRSGSSTRVSRRLISDSPSSRRRSRSKSLNEKASGSDRSTSHRSQHSISRPRSTSNQTVKSRRSESSTRVSRRLVFDSPSPPRSRSKSLNKKASSSDRSTSYRSQHSISPRSTSHQSGKSRRSRSYTRLSRRLISESPSPRRSRSKSLNKNDLGSSRSTSHLGQQLNPAIAPPTTHRSVKSSSRSSTRSFLTYMANKRRTLSRSHRLRLNTNTSGVDPSTSPSSHRLNFKPRVSSDTPPKPHQNITSRHSRSFTRSKERSNSQRRSKGSGRSTHLTRVRSRSLLNFGRQSHSGSQQRNTTSHKSSSSFDVVERRLTRMEVTVNKIFVMVGDIIKQSNKNLHQRNEKVSKVMMQTRIPNGFAVPDFPIRSVKELSLFHKTLKRKEVRSFMLESEKDYCTPSNSSNNVVMTAYLKRFISVELRCDIALKDAKGRDMLTLYGDFSRVYNFLIDVMKKGFDSYGERLKTTEVHTILRTVWSRSNQMLKEENNRNKIKNHNIIQNHNKNKNHNKTKNHNENKKHNKNKNRK